MPTQEEAKQLAKKVQHTIQEESKKDDTKKIIKWIAIAAGILIGLILIATIFAMLTRRHRYTKVSYRN